MAKVRYLIYSELDKTAIIRVSGHFTEAAKLAHQLADTLLRPNGRWRFTKIIGIMPPDYEFADETTIEITAKNIPEN